MVELLQFILRIEKLGPGIAKVVVLALANLVGLYMCV